jgi:hypothetical protein
MKKLKACAINTLFVTALIFFFITMSIAGVQIQKSLLGVTGLEKRVMALEIETDQKAGLYKESE